MMLVKVPMGKPVSPHGFVSYASDGTPTYLPLRSVSAKVYIVDVSARVVLTQIYHNSDSNNNQCASAQYIFPVPANGAVCAFTMQTADGRMVRGVVKEREQAEKEYKFAIAHNTFAGLVYEATPDIFVITMGAIPGGQDVQVTIMYITPLADSDLPGYDQIEFTLPTYIGIRYGPPPASLPRIHSSSQRLASHSSHSHSEKTMLDIAVHIQMPSEILEIVSCTHDIKVDAHTTRTDSRFGLSTSYTATVTLDASGSPPRLNRDFVLAIRAAQLGSPRCVAEVVKAPYSVHKAKSASSVAFALTFVPRLKLRASVSSSTLSSKLPHVQRQHEYIFLIDRSGSMAHSRIELAKEALTLFVKSLPSTVDGAGVRTTFNVFGFGSTCVRLWNTSRVYDEANVRAALDHVKSIDANLGGTEILHALRCVLQACNSAIPTSIFVLTDGEVYDVEAIFALVSSAVAQSTPTSQNISALSPSPAPLRFFTLGIGDSASTALCEGIARAGGGVCLMSRKEADVSAKCGRLLTAAESAALGVFSGGNGGVGLDLGTGSPSNSGGPKGQSGGTANCAGEIEIDWGHGRGKLLQAPTRISALHPENRFTAFAILEDVDVDADGIPDEVVLYQRGKDGKQSEVGRVNVCLVEDPMHTLSKGYEYGTRGANKNTPPLIHTMAAHRIIQQLEDGNIDTLHAVRGQTTNGIHSSRGTDERERRAEVVRLSERFQVASRWASFVAVEDTLHGDGDGNLGVDNKNNTGKVVANEDDNADDDDDDDDFYLDEEEEAHAHASKSRTVKLTSTANVSSTVQPNSNGNIHAKQHTNPIEHSGANPNATADTPDPSSIGGLYPKTDRPTRGDLNVKISGARSGGNPPRMTDTSTYAPYAQTRPHNTNNMFNAVANHSTIPASTSCPVPVSSTSVSPGTPKPLAGSGRGRASTAWNYPPWPDVDNTEQVNGGQIYVNSNANVSAQSRGFPSTTAINYGAGLNGEGAPSTNSGAMGRPLGLRRSHTRITSASALPRHDVLPASSTMNTTAKVSSSTDTRGTMQIPSHFVNAFRPPGPPTGSAPPATSNPCAGQNSVSNTAGQMHAKGSIYFLDTISTIDEDNRGFAKNDAEVSSTQTSVGHVDGPRDVPQNTVLPPVDMHYKVVQSAAPPPVGRDACLDNAHAAAAGCHVHMRMPGAYPYSHGCCPCLCFCCCCCSHRHCHHHHHHHNYSHVEPQSTCPPPPPPPPIHNPTPAPAPIPQPSHLDAPRHSSVPVRGGRLGARPQSVMYELETAVCIPSFLDSVSGTAVLGTVDKEDEERDNEDAPLLFVPTFASKTGVYRASNTKQGDNEDESGTARAPIIAAANMQRFDGSFVLDAQLHVLMGNSRRNVSLERLREAIPARLKERVGANVHEAETVWATVLVAAYLKKSLPQEKEVWIGLWDKAAAYVEGKVGRTASQGLEGLSFARLVLEASRLV
uniref:VWFA domain-containing protein n=1 Tax=Psilocybe cubensis TaxID=181762 RepID=A0A8H7XQN0_PSICU